MSNRQMEVQTGECIYCGQLYQLDVEGIRTEEERNHLATSMCNCDAAINAQKSEMIQTKAEENVEHLFRQEYPDMASLLKTAVLPIMGGWLDQIVIKAGRITGKVSRANDGGIKVEKNETKKAVLKS